MAVVNQVTQKFTHPKDAVSISGRRVMEVINLISIDATDDDGSIYFLAEVPDSAILERIDLEGPALTGATNFDVGIYDVNGNVLNVNKLATGLDLSVVTGLPLGPTGRPVRQCMTNLTLAEAIKNIAAILGHVAKAFPAPGEVARKGKYRIGLRGNVVGTATGQFLARVRYVSTL